MVVASVATSDPSAAPLRFEGLHLLIQPRLELLRLRSSRLTAIHRVQVNHATLAHDETLIVQPSARSCRRNKRATSGHAS